MKKFIFFNVAGYRSAILLRKELALTFLKNFAYRFCWQNTRTAILKKTISIRRLQVAASVSDSNFLKKQNK